MPSIPLPHAVPGAVVTRFPPEPSWHLDIGHCKAALMNQFVAAQFQGRWILRFDDTNPKTCSGPCVETYLRDMPLLGLHPDAVSHASDYFAAMIADVAPLIESGLLYADDTPVELMRQQRLAKQASAARDRPTSASLAAWAEMHRGSAAGQAFCLRFRLQPGSENGALRDPVAYRVILEPHYKTGSTFSAYPTYDFACPWLDAAEGVSHALRTLEFRDRDCLYSLVQQAVVALHPGWRCSTIWEFPRIHMAHTPQAKAHQRALMAAGLVDGPCDPRLPTLAGLMRAGCHPDALREFLLEQVTPARKETYHSWDKLWTLNRRLLDPRASRHMAVDDAGRVLLTIAGGPAAPECAEVAWKQGHVVEVVRYRQAWLDQADAELLSAGDEITLLAWGNATITSVTRAAAAAVGQQPLPEQQQQQQQQQQHEQGAAAAGTTRSEADAADGTVGIPQALGKQAKQSSSPAAGSSPILSRPMLEPAAAPAGDADSFRDVLAMRDQIVSAGGRSIGCSSCASTAGSTVLPQSVCTSVDQEELEEPRSHGDDEQQLQQQQQRQLLYEQQQQTTDEDLSALLTHAAALRPAAAEPASKPAAAAAGPVTHLTAVLNPSGDPKASKLKVHWLPALPQLLLPLRLVSFSHPVLVNRVVEEVDVVAEFNTNSRRESLAWGDPSLLLSARKGAVVQLQRKGLFVVEQLQLKPGAAAAAAAAVAVVAAAAAGAAAAVQSHAVADAGDNDLNGGSGSLLDDLAVVPTGAEDLKAAAALLGVPVHKVALTPGVSVSDVQQLVLFAIPDGHTKHETM